MTTEPDRLTRLEAVVEGLASSTDKLESSVQALVSRQGRWDWSAVGVMVAVAGGLIAFFFFGPVRNLERSIESAVAAAEQRSVDNRRDIESTKHDIKALDDRLTQQIIDEQKRNNEITKELAAETAISALYKAGMLVNPQRSAP